MAAVRHFEFVKFWYFVTWPSLEPKSAVAHQISLISDDPWLVMKPFSKRRLSAILNFRKLLFSSRVVCLSMVVLVHAKYRVNRTITHGDIAKIRFSIWRLSAILNFIIFNKSGCDRPWNKNFSLHTNFHENRMISGRDIAINHFQHGGRPPSWILKIWYFGHVNCVWTWFCFFTQNFALIGQ